MPSHDFEAADFKKRFIEHYGEPADQVPNVFQIKTRQESLASAVKEVHDEEFWERYPEYKSVTCRVFSSGGSHRAENDEEKENNVPEKKSGDINQENRYRSENIRSHQNPHMLVVSL